MRARLIRCGMAALIFGLALAGTLSATTYYVAPSGLDSRTGSGDWTNAVLTISNAVSKAGNNDTILVSNGVYVVTTQITVTASLTIRGKTGNSADVTVNGNYPTTTNRCFFINHYNALLADMTITNGNSGTNVGGGIFLQTGTVSNCLITGNSAYKIFQDDCDGGGGIAVGGSVAYTGAVLNCQLVGNLSSNYGGGIGIKYGSWNISGCRIIGNTTKQLGGGLYTYMPSANYSARISDCYIASNASTNAGGGCYLTYGGIISNCTIEANSNTAGQPGGGVVLYNNGQSGPTIRNCLLVRNVIPNTGVAPYGGGLFIDGEHCKVSNCTIVSNLAKYGGGLGSRNEGAAGNLNKTSMVENCIIWGNTTYGETTTNIYLKPPVYVTFTNCCFAPYVTNSYPTNSMATNSITRDPRLVSIAGGNYRLSNGSPCINAGANQSWMDNTLDLDGRNRVDRYYRQVDMGAYEFVFHGTIISVR